MRLWNVLLLLSLAPAADAGTLLLTTPLSLQLSSGTASASITGGASDLSVTRYFEDDFGSGYNASAALAIPETYHAGLIQEPSPLTFRLNEPARLLR